MWPPNCHLGISGGFESLWDRKKKNLKKVVDKSEFDLVLLALD